MKHPQLKLAFNQYLRQARQAFNAGDYTKAFQDLERAHILGQQQTMAHVLTHWWMLRIGWRQQDWREIRGQLLRLPAALIFSRVWVPLGNTGGANVSAMQPMPIPADLAVWLNDSSPCKVKK